MSSTHLLNPTTLVLPSDSSSTKPIERKLILRNATNKEIAVRIIPSHPSTFQVSRPSLKVGPQSIALIDLHVHYSHVSHLANNTLSVYAVPGYLNGINQWESLVPASLPTRQLAACLQFQFTDSLFSSPATVIELPGSASLVEPFCGQPCMVEINETPTAIDLHKEVATQRENAYMTDCIKRLKTRESQKTSKENADDGNCWLMEYVFGAPQKKKKKSREKTERGESLYACADMNATPCAGGA